MTWHCVENCRCKIDVAIQTRWPDSRCIEKTINMACRPELYKLPEMAGENAFVTLKKFKELEKRINKLEKK